MRINNCPGLQEGVWLCHEAAARVRSYPCRRRDRKPTKWYLLMSQTLQYVRIYIGYRKRPILNL